MYLFFDTETNGLPLNGQYKAPASDTHIWPRMIQIAWEMYDETGFLLSSRSELIQPDEWEVPTDKFWLDNGFSQEKNLTYGLPVVPVLNDFLAALEKSKYLVAHNINFDDKVVSAELIRYSLPQISGVQKIYTMQSSTDYCEIPGQFGNYKWPNLTELHHKLFGVGFDGAHDALVDVKACAKSFFALKEKGVV
ncbi:MAG: 3'-5' exonuclease [Salinivirgaceae bacterium]|nr:3'-5' exonuclease [Salinivirgaceae bacterium]